MSRFYGTLRGQAKTTATRRGGKNSGVQTAAASWSGAVRVSVYADGMQDRAKISFIQWQGEDGIVGREQIIYDGPIAPTLEEYFRDVIARAQALAAAAKA